MRTFRITLRNRSAWPLDLVWENALDLEHVAVLHRRTNASFRLVSMEPSTDPERPYDALAYVVRRRIFGLLRLTTLGFRRVTGPREILQVDRSPLLGISTTLRSTLEPDPGDPERTDLVDHVEVSLPRALGWLRPWIEAGLRRHARIQCEEDEAFRSRRAELRSRGIRLPLSLLNPPPCKADGA